MSDGRRIDTQHHFLPPRYLDAVGSEAIARTLVSGRIDAWTPEVSLAAMDRHGIAAAVLSIAAPGFPVDRAVDLCRYCNDFARDVIDGYPGRFGWFAALPLPDIEASLAELRRCLDDLGADGVGLLTSYDNRYLGDRHFDRLFDALAERNAVVYVHPTEPPGRPLELLPAASLEYPFETVRAIASLLFSGTLARSRSAKYLFSHAGGGLPVLAERLARLQRRPDFAAAVPDGVRAELSNLNFDIALSAGPLTLRSLLEFTTPQHVLFASDFPFAPEEAMAGSVAGLAKAGLSEKDLHAIETENAFRLMPRLARRVGGGTGAVWAQIDVGRPQL